MLQGIVAHNLLKAELVFAGFLETERCLCDANTMLKYIVHTSAQPSFFIIAQLQVYLLLFFDGICWAFGINIQPDIIVPVSIGVPQYNKHIIQGTCICDRKTDKGFVAGWP